MSGGAFRDASASIERAAILEDENRVLGEQIAALQAEVEALTGHPVGGVCPFGLAHPLAVYCDVSLRAFEEVVPAAGATNAAVRISPARMAEITGADWVDVCG